MIRIEARPESISLDLASAAVVVVDMQNDFGAEGGMFARAGIDVSAIRGVIAPIGKVLDAARHSGILVVYLKMGFQHDLSDAGLPDAPNWLKHRALNVGQAITAPVRPSRILVRETWNTEIVEELAPDHDDVVLYKHRFSGFYETDLDVTQTTGDPEPDLYWLHDERVWSPRCATRCSVITDASCLRTVQTSRSAVSCSEPTMMRRSWSWRRCLAGSRDPRSY